MKEDGGGGLDPAVNEAVEADELAFKKLRSYILRFGYLPASNSPENPDSFDEPLESAVFSYQRSLALPLTGKLDTETLGQIVSPRCGISDGQIDLLLPMVVDLQVTLMMVMMKLVVSMSFSYFKCRETHSRTSQTFNSIFREILHNSC